MTPHLRGEHHALFDDEPAREEGLERGEKLVLGQGGQEAQAAEVDAEYGHAQVAHETRHGQECAVAAQNQHEIHLPRQVGLRQSCRVRIRAQPRRLFLEDRLQPALGAPGEQTVHDVRGIGPVDPGDDADPLHAGSEDSAALAMSASRSLAVRPERVR